MSREELRPLWSLVEKWRKDSIERTRWPYSMQAEDCADELESDLRAWAESIDEAERNPTGMSIGPLYDMGINVARKQIRDILGVPAKESSNDR